MTATLTKDRFRTGDRVRLGAGILGAGELGTVNCVDPDGSVEVRLDDGGWLSNFHPADLSLIV